MYSIPKNEFRRNPPQHCRRFIHRSFSSRLKCSVVSHACPSLSAPLLVHLRRPAATSTTTHISLNLHAPASPRQSGNLSHSHQPHLHLHTPHPLFSFIPRTSHPCHRALTPLMAIPGMISLGGGLPNPSTFPFQVCRVTRDVCPERRPCAPPSCCLRVWLSLCPTAAFCPSMVQRLRRRCSTGYSAACVV
jgi:hypothetical protein